MARPRPVILFYNRLFPRMPDPGTIDCDGTCHFTTDLGRLAEAAAVVFHIPTLGRADFPPKRAGQRWVAWSMESEVAYPSLADPAFMARFDVTMTYQRRSTVWCPYFGPGTDDDLLMPARPKTESSPAVYFQSGRVDRSGRTVYAAELMKRVKVDSYGQVLHNRDLPGPDQGRATMLAVTARYKFTLVFENSIAVDYVSDKFFDALIAGSVPVYRGAPNVVELAPADRCFIDAADFSGPAELADRLNWLDRNETAYQQYLAWKRGGLSSRFRSLVASLRGHALCRLCDHLRRHPG